jgi:hypothetical protein
MTCSPAPSRGACDRSDARQLKTLLTDYLISSAADDVLFRSLAASCGVRSRGVVGRHADRLYNLDDQVLLTLLSVMSYFACDCACLCQYLYQKLIPVRLIPYFNLFC